MTGGLGARLEWVTLCPASGVFACPAFPALPWESTSMGRAGRGGSCLLAPSGTGHLETFSVTSLVHQEGSAWAAQSPLCSRGLLPVGGAVGDAGLAAAGRAWHLAPREELEGWGLAPCQPVCGGGGGGKEMSCSDSAFPPRRWAAEPVPHRASCCSPGPWLSQPARLLWAHWLSAGSSLAPAVPSHALVPAEPCCGQGQAQPGPCSCCSPPAPSLGQEPWHRWEVGGFARGWGHRELLDGIGPMEFPLG